MWKCPMPYYQWPITKSFDLAVLDVYWVLAYMKNSIGALHTVYII